MHGKVSFTLYLACCDMNIADSFTLYFTYSDMNIEDYYRETFSSVVFHSMVITLDVLIPSRHLCVNGYHFSVYRHEEAPCLFVQPSESSEHSHVQEKADLVC